MAKNKNAQNSTARVETIEVEGERFRITVDGDGASYDWLTGPNKDYGFSLAVMGATKFTFPREFHVSQIRQFLADVDPETGLLPED
jgi:hypothetical protein